MKLLRRDVTAALFAALGAATAGTPAAVTAPHSGQDRPIDRWLVASVESADTLGAEARLSIDALDAPGELGVLPDRGAETAGATWRLVRRDGAFSVPLDSVFPDSRAGTVVYAHSYLRLPSDRTLRLVWDAADCTAARAWLNGREIPAGPVDARFGAGWNTLLIKLVAGDCPFGYRARLTSEAGRAETDATPHAATDDIRVQASRPFGDVRTGPDDWIVVADTARIAPERRWRDDRLYAGLVIGLTAWGRAPVSDVELELRGAVDGRATAVWLVPGSSDDVVVPVRIDRIERLLAADRIDVRLRWADAEIDRRVTVAGTSPGASERLALDGWNVAGPGSGGSGPSGRLPNAPAWTLEGKWRVPEALAGRSLVLETAGSPAQYLLNGSPVPVADGTVQLCAHCTRGVRLRLSATSTDPWASMPTVRIADRAGDR